MTLHIPQNISRDTAIWAHMPKLPLVLSFLLGNMSRLLAVTIYTFGCVLTSTAKLLFKELNDRLHCLSKCSDERKLKDELEQWRRHYHLTCRLVERINQCFSLILLVKLCHAFIQSTSYCILIIDIIDIGPENHKKYSIVLTNRSLALLGIVIRMWVLIFECYRVNIQVSMDRNLL